MTASTDRKDADGKILRERIAEACEMYTTLGTLGALRSESNRLVVTELSNAFVREGASARVRLPVDSGVFAEVVYASESSRRSGVSLTRSGPQRANEIGRGLKRFSCT